MSLDIHKIVNETLSSFIKIKKIPNIIFHGPTGSGKRTIVNQFINDIYKNNKAIIKQYVLYVECAHGKGIKFIREELKFFAKSHINITKSNLFKIIVMANADNLTIDAQSALRRCIEQYNHSTRFFIIIENKYKLLRPILSRFSQIYIHQPIINGINVNLNNYLIKQDNSEYDTGDTWLKNVVEKKNISQATIFNKSEKIYNAGFSCLDIMNLIEKMEIEETYKWRLLLTFNKIKKEFRNEILLIYFILNYMYFRLDTCLENVLIM